MEQGAVKVSKSWQRKFELIERAGGLDLPNVKSLSMWERMILNFNIWGFFLGPLYYIAKGMWKKGLFIFGIVAVVIILLDIFFGDSKAVDRLSMLLGPVIFATQSNTDYYKKMVLGINKWW
jgi:hypothetical protein